MELIEKQEMLGWNDVPVLLCAILQQLRVLNGLTPMPVTQDVVIEPRTEQAEKPDVEVFPADTSKYDEVHQFCLDLSAKNISNVKKIKEIIAKYTDGKVADIPLEKLDAFKAEVEASCE